MRGNFNLQLHYNTIVYNVQEIIQFFIIFLLLYLFHIHQLGIETVGGMRKSQPPFWDHSKFHFFTAPFTGHYSLPIIFPHIDHRIPTARVHGTPEQRC